jgi:hypothetical protein
VRHSPTCEYLWGQHTMLKSFYCDSLWLLAILSAIEVKHVTGKLVSKHVPPRLWSLFVEDGTGV